MYTFESTQNPKTGAIHNTIRDSNGAIILSITSAYPERVAEIVNNLNDGSLSVKDLLEQYLVYARIICPTSVEYIAFKSTSKSML
jgi:hypothetical protein